MVSKFQEYPKVMKHPQHAPAVWRQLEGKGKGLFAPDTVCTSPERFPDVTVSDIDQEKQYAARGYRPANNPDPIAYEQSILEAAPSAGYVFQPFPKWKYHPMQLPCVVKNADEERALGADWHDAPVMATEEDAIAASTNSESVATEAVITKDSEPSAMTKVKRRGRPKKTEVAHI